MAGKDDKKAEAKGIIKKYFEDELFLDEAKVLTGFVDSGDYKLLRKTLKEVSVGKVYGSNPTQGQKDLMKSASESYNALKSIGMYNTDEKKKDAIHTKPKFKLKEESKEPSKPAAENKKIEEPAAKTDADKSYERLVGFLNDYKGGEAYEHSLKGHLVGYLTAKPLKAEDKKTGRVKGVKNEIYRMLDGSLEWLNANPNDVYMQEDFNMLHGLLIACYDNGIFKKKDEDRLTIYSKWIESRKNLQDLEDELFNKTIELQNQLTAYEARFPGEKATPLQERLKKYWTENEEKPDNVKKAPEPKAMDIDVQAREKSLDLDEHRKESVQAAETTSADIGQQTIDMKQLAKKLGTEKAQNS